MPDLIHGMKRPSPALVISLIALFVSLGGTSYAVTAIDDNSVTTAKIKDGAVTSPKLANSSVTGMKLGLGSVGEFVLGANSVTSTKVKDGSLDIPDLKTNAFGDLTVVPQPLLNVPTTIRSTVSLGTWHRIDGAPTMKVAAGSHLAFVRFAVKIGRETSGTSRLDCLMTNGNPTSSSTTTYDGRGVSVSDVGAISERIVLMAPVTVAATTELMSYCRITGTDPDDFTATVYKPRWEAVHLTGTHGPPS